MGLFGQSCRTPQPAPQGETCRQRLLRPRKSQTWAQAIAQTGGPPEGSQWIYVADRESDFYEPLAICQEHGVDFIVRTSNDRRLADEAGHLFQALAQAPVLGRCTVEVRASAGRPARTAIVELRSTRVDLDGPWRPGGWQQPLRGVGIVDDSQHGKSSAELGIDRATTDDSRSLTLAAGGGEAQTGRPAAISATDLAAGL